MSDTSFAKLFSSITKSTVWAEPHPTRIVWVTMLAECDRHGDVYASVPGLAHVARVTLAECETALATFLAPDPYSRTPDHDGRRIEVIPGGWRLLNYGLYREKRDPGARTEQNREAAQRYRDRQRSSSSTVSKIADAADDQPESAHAEADTDTETTHLTVSSRRARSRTPDLDLSGWPSQPSPAVLADWLAHRKAKRAPITPTVIASFGREIGKAMAHGFDADACLTKCMNRNWQGFEADWLLRDLPRALPNQPSPAPTGKTMQGLMALEAMKSGNRLAAGRDPDRAAEALPALAGPDPRR